METEYLSATKSKDIQRAAFLLKKGEIVAFPTETVFGLGINFSREAREKLYQVKQRDQAKTLTIHCSSYEKIKDFVEAVPAVFDVLAKTFLPGPLTIVMRAKKTCPFTKEQTIGVRWPAHQTAIAFIEACGGAIFATSANYSGKVSCLSIEEVKKAFHGKIAAIIEDDSCKFQKASTVISIVNDLCILREGVITKKQLQKVLQNPILYV